MALSYYKDVMNAQLSVIKTLSKHIHVAATQSSQLLTEHISNSLHISARIHSQDGMKYLRGLQLVAISPRVKLKMI